MAVLLVFVDESDGVYGLIAVGESSSGRLSSEISWVKHPRRLGRKKKRGYFRAFKRRFEKARKLLVYARVFYEIERLEKFLAQIMPRIKTLYIDDRLYSRLRSRSFECSQVEVVLESKAGKTRLMLLADSLANYARRKPRDVKELEK